MRQRARGWGWGEAPCAVHNLDAILRAAQPARCLPAHKPLLKALCSAAAAPLPQPRLWTCACCRARMQTRRGRSPPQCVSSSASIAMALMCPLCGSPSPPTRAEQLAVASTETFGFGVQGISPAHCREAAVVMQGVKSKRRRTDEGGVEQGQPTLLRRAGGLRRGAGLRRADGLRRGAGLRRAGGLRRAAGLGRAGGLRGGAGLRRAGGLRGEAGLRRADGLRRAGGLRRTDSTGVAPGSGGGTAPLDNSHLYSAPQPSSCCVPQRSQRQMLHSNK